MSAGLTGLGLIGGLLLLIYLSVLMGMSLVFAVLFVIFSVGVFIALTWQIINGGIPWWPIHPIEYTMLSSWASFKLWFSIMLGYFLKYGIVKYGGLRAYREARPLFLGLILGEMTLAGLWSIVGMITGVQTGYRILLD